VRGRALTQMIEGEKTFDITPRWPAHQREDLSSILEIPVDVLSNQLTPGPAPSAPQSPTTGPSTGPSASGAGKAPPAVSGSAGNAPYNSFLPRLRIKDLVSPVGADNRIDPKGSFFRPGASIIFREQGRRFIAVKFSVRDRDLASAVAEAKEQ